MKTVEKHKLTSNRASSVDHAPFFRKEEGKHIPDGVVESPFFVHSAIQPKLMIGRPGDKYEQEADAMADQVVQRLSDPQPENQTKCTACAQEERRLSPKRIQPKAIFESNEEPPLQRKCATCSAGEPLRIQPMPGSEEPDLQASSDLENRLNATKGSGSPLPEETRGSMESAFGTDFSGVRVHTGSSAVQMNQELGAQAFTHGSDIHFNAGKYDTGSSEGQRLLAHELTHVVQQGGVKRQPQASGEAPEEGIQKKKGGIQRESPASEIGRRQPHPPASFYETVSPAASLDIQRQKKPLRQVLNRLNHHSVLLLDLNMIFLESLKNIVESPDKPLKTQRQKKRWHRGRFFRRLTDASLYKRYKEADGRLSPDLTVAMIGLARRQINALSAKELGVNSNTLAKIKGHYHRKLNAFSPYFTQMANRNVLPKGPGNQAWRRTCNMTSMAMVLNALGVSANDFSGNRPLLVRIASHFEPSLKNFGELAALRMPDFLQLVMIYIKFLPRREKRFRKRANRARRVAAKQISTTLNVFPEIGARFGVKRIQSKGIPSYGARAKKNKLTPSQLRRRYPWRRYRRRVMQQLTPYLNMGAQIISNQPGHYTRLEDIDRKGITIDDPANKGKNYFVSWRRANRIGYFRSYQAFVKK